MNAFERRELVNKIAKQKGMTVEKLDLRSHFLHLRDGAKVYYVPLYRGICAEMIERQMGEKSLENCWRLDQVETSMYFVRAA
ncbi:MULTISPECIES: hypothetical protein [Pseudomonas]|uniref:Uncharacterized protein n=1 Tax=Pseudomonas lutea TaxID=243924 RepID=A0A9X8MH86_9PSED|nr:MULTISPECIES: hypothetical protein [Pseudomonas]SER37861.1 hypothetical protein SAMN05216409_118114 [Pseudomonas lutea]